MSNLLELTQVGNPILRRSSHLLTDKEILSKEIQKLIVDMRYTLAKESLGVGLAAPQVGHGVAMSIIGIKPTTNRPELEPFESVIINPRIVATHGARKPMWEGCVSCGLGDDTLFAQVPRYASITLEWKDEHAVTKREKLEGFVAHVAQHEVDHLQGILFLDRVEDTASYMMSGEYRKRILKKRTRKVIKTAKMTS